MTNKNNTVLYTGVTSDLRKKTFQHKEKLLKGFTKKYIVDKLVYYEMFGDIRYAIQREKQIKSGSRRKKINQINTINKTSGDLYDEL